MDIESCDTFVVFPPLTENNKVVFGKNSDRRAGEVQEVVHIPRIKHAPNSKLECTFIEIDQVSETNGVMLSKPSWMWGAEMGANEHGVVVGNEAVFTKIQDDGDEERLLGMDLVRLALERANTAESALRVVTNLLETHGQGGPCEERVDAVQYHNSFIIADVNEAWVLETAGRLWAAEKVVSGYRNISNCLSIGTKIDATSDNLLDEAKLRGLWSESEPFNFSEVFTQDVERLAKHRERYAAGSALLAQHSKDNAFNIYSMMNTLNDESSNICRRMTAEFPTAASQISILSKDGQHVHWFNGVPDPKHSIFKPFVFVDNVQVTSKICSKRLSPAEEPVKMKPRFATIVDRRHHLYKLYEQCYEKIVEESISGANIRQKMSETQANFVKKVERDEFANKSEMFNEAVNEEIQFYESLLPETK